LLKASILKYTWNSTKDNFFFKEIMGLGGRQSLEKVGKSRL
jgi:hypothetical protein